MPEPPQHPLSLWRLRGFRSIRDDTVFALGGLNILVGANSAGKSSVLHSLLMVAQTLANPQVDRPLVLNGHLVRLGLADDIVHESGSVELELGFELRPPTDISARGARNAPDIESQKVDASFARSSDNDFEIDKTTAVATPRGEGGVEQLLMERRATADTRTAYVNAGLSVKEAASLAKNFPLPAVDGDAPIGAVGVRAQQFFPSDIWRVANAHDRDIVFLQWAASRYEAQGEDVAQLRHLEIREGTCRFLRNYLQDEVGAAAAAPVRCDGNITLDELIPALSRDARSAIANMNKSPWFLAHRDSLPFLGEVENAGLPPTLGFGLNHARAWFAQNVVHLGPLRAAPQPLYELPLAASERSVGKNGEFTAAVLNAHANTSVVSPDPKTGHARRRPLRTAVNEWVGSLNLLSSVESKESGKLGYELHLKIEGVSRDLDLTTVGVGVSQALPIIVLGLITEPGSLLLFEQPELHLHPDVQASLGDFFLALARTGRQLIVETHSDYLINRLRRRAADDDASDVPDQVRLFFFEREGASSSVQQARIAPNGGMPDWPQGFLDTASREIEEMAHAALRRTKS